MTVTDPLLDASRGPRISVQTELSSPRIRVALDCVANGYQVFPCHADKTPATAHGHKDATDKQSQVQTWWGKNPDYLVGIATGAGMVVLDFDEDRDKGLVAADAQAAAEQKLLVPFPETFVAKTRRGGWHRYYRTTETLGIGSAMLGIPGFDLRGDGGYVIVHGDAAPPHVDDLAELPGSVAVRLSAPRKERPTLRVVSREDLEGVVSLPRAKEELAKVCGRISDAPHGSCHDLLLRLSRLVGGWVGAKQLSKEDAVAGLTAALATRPDPDKHMQTMYDGLEHGVQEPREADPGWSLRDWKKAEAGDASPTTPTVTYPAGGPVAATDGQKEDAHAPGKEELDALARHPDAKKYALALLGRGNCKDAGLLASLLLRRNIELGLGSNPSNAWRAALSAMRVHERSKEKEATTKKTNPTVTANMQSHNVDLRLNNSGRPETTFMNVVRVLASLRMFWRDELKSVAMVRDTTGASKPLDDALVRSTRRMLGESWDLHPSAEMVHDAILEVAGEETHHPVREYLHSLAWDGEERLALLGQLGMCGDQGEELNVYNGELLKKWCIAAVARVMRPGCKADNMIVLVGEQDVGKSSCIQTLVGEKSGWCNDNAISADEKRALLEIPGYWVHEIGELAGLRSRELESMKLFITRLSDTGVPMFSRTTATYPRSCVFFGTTNDRTFLTDPTGDRRFWVLEARKVDLEWIRANRDQLWAEAMSRYDAGEKWYLTREEAGLVREKNAEYRPENIVAEAVAQKITDSQQTTWKTRDMYRDLLLFTELEKKLTETAIGRAFADYGWSRKHTKTGWVWLWTGSDDPRAVGPKGTQAR